MLYKGLIRSSTALRWMRVAALTRRFRPQLASAMTAKKAFDGFVERPITHCP